MNELEILKKIIDDEAICYINHNKEHYNRLLNEWIKIGTPYILGIDLSNSNDMTATVYVSISKGVPCVI